VNHDNPYFVLELSPSATPGEIERQGRKIIGLIELGAAKGVSYTCALGTFPRDATMVREAIAALHDPKRRAREACLVKLLGAPSDSAAAHVAAEAELDAPLDEAFAIGGYRGF
jgi:hypothetical protein